jgi:serine/threonine protein kinase
MDHVLEDSSEPGVLFLSDSGIIVRFSVSMAVNQWFIIIMSVICTAAIVTPAVALSIWACFRVFKWYRYEKQIKGKLLQRQVTYGSDNTIHQRDWIINTDKITIGEIIGEGAHATTFVGLYLKKPVTIKMLKRKVSTAIMENELAILMSLNNPNIVRFIGASVKHNLIVTELIDGTILEEIVTGDESVDKLHLRVSFRKKLILLSYVADGMRYLESKSVLHRDLKPANIMVDKDFKVAKIIDFGISRYMSVEMTGHVGTIEYMAPELVNKEEDCQYTAACDAYRYELPINCINSIVLVLSCTRCFLRRNHTHTMN